MTRTTIAVTTFLCLLAGSSTSAQVFVPAELVMKTSDPVPMLGSITAGTLWSAVAPSAPSVDGNGNIAFYAALATGSGAVPVTSSTDGTYWYGGPAAITMQLREGDPTPDNANSGGVGAIVTSRQLLSVPMSPSGHMWFGASTSGGTAVSQYFWTGLSGALQYHAKHRDAFSTLPLDPPGTTPPECSLPASSAGATVYMNNLGHCVTSLNLVCGVGDTYACATPNLNQLADLLGGPGGPAGQTPLLRRHSPNFSFPGAPGTQFSNGIGTFGHNHSDDTIHFANLLVGSGGAAATDNSVIWGIYGGVRVPIAREGAATGIPGIAYGVDAAGTFPFWAPNSIPPRQIMNNTGRMIFQPQLLAGAGITSANNTAIMTWLGGTTSIVAQKGDLVAVTGGTAVSLFNSFTLSNSNQVAWTATMVPSSLFGSGNVVTGVNDSILAVTTIGGGTKVLVQRGTQVPGMPAGVLWGDPGNVAINAAGLVVFASTLTGTGITTADDFSYWLYSPGCGPKQFRMLARESDLRDGFYVLGVSTNNDANGEGSCNGLNDDNWLAFSIRGSLTAGGAAAGGAFYRVHFCAADVDDGFGSGIPDGGVDISDLLYFLTAFEAGTCPADLDNGSGAGLPDEGVDISDLLFFLAKFEAGC